MNSFIAVATQLSFTQAANALHISQSTISKHIGALENELGLSLFIRSNKNVVLTNDGERLLIEFREINKKLQEIVDWTKENQKEYLKISYTGVIDYDIAYNSLLKFQNSYPNINVDLQEIRFKDIGNYLINEKADVVLAHELYFTDIHNISFKNIAECKFRVALNRNHHLNRFKEINFEDLVNENIIMLSRHEFFIANNAVRELFKMHNFVPKSICECSDLSTPFLYVEANKGVFVVCTRSDYLSIKGVNIIDLRCKTDCKMNLTAAWLTSNNNPYIHQYVNAMSCMHTNMSDKDS